MINASQTPSAMLASQRCHRPQDRGRARPPSAAILLSAHHAAPLPQLTTPRCCVGINSEPYKRPLSVPQQDACPLGHAVRRLSAPAKKTEGRTGKPAATGDRRSFARGHRRQRGSCTIAILRKGGRDILSRHFLCHSGRAREQTCLRAEGRPFREAEASISPSERDIVYHL